MENQTNDFRDEDPFSYPKMHPTNLLTYLCSVLRIQIRDPRFGAFLTPGSGIRNRFFPDPGSLIPDPSSQTHIIEGLVTTFWGVKSSSLKFGPNFFL